MTLDPVKPFACSLCRGCGCQYCADGEILFSLSAEAYDKPGSGLSCRECGGETCRVHATYTPPLDSLHTAVVLRYDVCGCGRREAL